MKAVFTRLDNSVYEQTVAKVRCGGYYLHFYDGVWEHEIIRYDIPLGLAKIYSPDECVENCREIRGIKLMEIINDGL